MYVIDFALTSIETIDGPAPAGPVISGQTLARLREESGLRAQWMAQAQAERVAALAEREQARIDAQASRDAWQEAARERAQQEAAELAETARHEAVVKAVEWLIDEAALEREIIRSLERRVADALTGALSNFVGTLDVGERFAQRVGRALPGLAREGALVLRVPPAHHDAVALALQKADIVLACTPDATLGAQQARIESEWVTVCLDLEADLAAVIERLHVSPSLEVAYG
jgi:flagellar biosynthesis/type III secretory pathway protein FliH